MKDPSNQIGSGTEDIFYIESYTDSQALAKFVDMYRDSLCSEPTKAYGAFKDLLGGREDLTSGSREILSRAEWSYILDEKCSEAVASSHLYRLRSWIAMTYSSTTASPWLETLSKFDHRPTESNPIYNQGGKKRSPATQRYKMLRAGMIIAIALISLAIIRTLSGHISQYSTQVASDKKGLDSKKSTTKRPAIQADELFGDTEAFTQARSNVTRENNEDYAKEPQNNEQDSMVSRRIERFDKTPNHMYEASGTGQRSNGLNWEGLKRRIDNGQLSNSDLSASSAENYLRHWVQSFKLKSNNLTIILRTNSEVDAKICKLMLGKYQEKYRSLDGRAPFVILESSRYSGKTLNSGYLPTCQLSPSGEFSRV